jgi:transcriptional regulator with XRE-family HTH domain
MFLIDRWQPTWCMMNSLLNQMKKRRIALALKQHDMMLRVGISRQQYQRLESKGNPRLDTLELVAKGLQSELLLIPREKLNDVQAVLAGQGLPAAKEADKENRLQANTSQRLEDDPWQGLLGDDE